jgi:formylglycine-generating enzyme required for sulfatase activity
MLQAKAEAEERPPDNTNADMVFIPGGTFRMGSDHHYPEEAPSHRVSVDAFWIDATPVTNLQFKEFVKATGHVTTAQIPPDPKDYPGALPHMICAGSLVRKCSGASRHRNRDSSERRLITKAPAGLAFGNFDRVRGGYDDYPLHESIPQPGGFADVRCARHVGAACVGSESRFIFPRRFAIAAAT